MSARSLFFLVCLFLGTVACAALVPVAPTLAPTAGKVITLAAPSPTATGIILPTETLHPTLAPTATPRPRATALPTATPGPGTLLLELDYAQRGLAFSEARLSPDARYLGVRLGNENAAEVWEVASGQSWRVELPSNEHVFHLGATEKAAWVVVYMSTQSGDLSIWEVSPTAKSPTLVFDLFQAEHAFWLHKGGAAPEQRTRVFELTENEAELWVTDVAISPDGKTFAVGYSAGELCLFRASDGKLLWRKATAHHDWVGSLVFSPNGRYLFSDSFSFDPFTYVWEAKTGKKLATLSEESYEPMPGFFSVASDLVGLQTVDSTRIFQTGSWQSLGPIPIPVFNLLTSDKNIPAAITMQPFELENGKRVFVPPPGLIFLPDGRILLLDTSDEAQLLRLYQLAP